MTLLLSFIALLPRMMLGYGIIHFFWNAGDGKSLLIKAFLSAGIGFGISSLFGFLWIWLGFPLTVYVILESIVAIALTGWLFFTKRIKLRFVKQADGSSAIWNLFLAVGIFLFAINLALYSLQYPHGRPDAWINWNVAARFIYLGGENWQATFLRHFDHPDYPLFMALTNAMTWVFVRETSTWGPIAFHFTTSLSLAGLLFAFVNYFQGFKQASLAVVLFTSLPFIVDQSMRQYADLLLSYLILAAGGLTLIYLNTREMRFATLAGLLIGLGGWAKNEGLMAIIGFSIVWILIAFKIKERLALKKYIWGLSFPFLVIALFKLFLAPSNDLLSARGNLMDRVFDIERYTTIFQEAGITLWNLGGAPVSLIGVMILVVFLVGKSHKKVSDMWIFGVFIAFQLAVYFLVFAFTPHDLAWHLSTSLDRLYLHVFPLAFLWLFIWLKSPQAFLS